MVLDELATVKLTPLQLSGLPLPDHGSPIVISVVRDEISRLPNFLRHYRLSGIERFAFVDNGSTDGTVAFLASQPDVDLYEKRGAFEWRLKQGWINKVVEIYGTARWYMYVDADELVVFDGLGDHTFSELIRLLEPCGIVRIRGFLIDMYSDGPLLRSTCQPGTSLIESYPWYDVGTYREQRHTEIISVKGGPRARVFGRMNPRFRPELTKYPIFKAMPETYMVNPHHIWPYSRNFDCGRILGILHFKFLPDILERIHKAVEAKNYWDGSLEYSCYLGVIQEDAEISLKSEWSVRFTSVAALAAQGLIARLKWDKAEPAAALMRNAFWRRREELLTGSATSEPAAADDSPRVISAPLQPTEKFLATTKPQPRVAAATGLTQTPAGSAPFQAVVVDQVYDNDGNYRHLDFRVRNFRIRDLVWKQLKFRICLQAGRPYLEFRRMPNWPDSFENWPALESDAFGPFMRLFATSDWAALRAGFSSRDSILIEGLGTCLSEIVAQVTASAGLAEDKRTKWIAAAALLTPPLVNFTGSSS